MDNPPHRYEVLDGLRGVAAVVVFGLHLPDRRLAEIAPLGHLSVDFFFLLSGFVLAHAYEKPLREGLSAGAFILRRYIRLMPFYLLGLAIGLLTMQGTPWAVAASMVMAPAKVEGSQDFFPFNVAAWSLFFELLVNAGYALIARRLTNLALGVILALGLAGLLAARIAYGTVDVGVEWGNALGGVPRVVWSFFAGVAVYRLHRARPAPGLAWPLFGLALAGLLMIPAPLLTVLAGFPLLVYFAASAQVRGLAAKACLTLGAVSYGLYAIHVPILLLIPREMLFSGRNILIALAVIGGLVLVLNKIYDEPIRRWATRRAFPRRTSLSAPGV